MYQNLLNWRWRSCREPTNEPSSLLASPIAATYCQCALNITSVKCHFILPTLFCWLQLYWRMLQAIRRFSGLALNSQTGRLHSCVKMMLERKSNTESKLMIAHIIACTRESRRFIKFENVKPVMVHVSTHGEMLGSASCKASWEPSRHRCQCRRLWIWDATDRDEPNAVVEAPIWFHVRYPLLIRPTWNIWRATPVHLRLWIRRWENGHSPSPHCNPALPARLSHDPPPRFHPAAAPSYLFDPQITLSGLQCPLHLPASYPTVRLPPAPPSMTHALRTCTILWNLSSNSSHGHGASPGLQCRILVHFSTWVSPL